MTIDLKQLRADAEAHSNPKQYMGYVRAETVLALIDTAEAAIEALAQGMGGYDFDDRTLAAGRRLRESLDRYTTS